MKENFGFIMSLDDMLKKALPFSSMGMPYLILVIIVGFVFSMVLKEENK